MAGHGQDQGHGRPALAEPVWREPDEVRSGTNRSTAATAVHPVELRIIPPELLDDLYVPDLVIDPGYIGPDRRRTPRELRRTSSIRDRSSGFVRTLLIVLATAAAVVPLTLMAIHPAPSATAATPAGLVAARAQLHGAGGLRTSGPSAPTGATGRAGVGRTRARGTAAASARIACAPAGRAAHSSCVRNRAAAHLRALARLRAARRALRTERAARRVAPRHRPGPAR